MNLNEYKELYQQAVGKQKSLQKRRKENKDEIKSLKKRIENIELAQVFIQTTAKEIQEGIRFHVCDVVQMAIDSCFPNKYEFRMEFDIKRNKTEASLNFYEKGNKVDPMNASGGGLVNLACFAIRIAAWSLSRTNPIILLDEPFANLSVDLQPMAGQILKELSEKLGFQIILVTHNRDSMCEIADKVFMVKMNKTEDGWMKSFVEVKEE